MALTITQKNDLTTEFFVIPPKTIEKLTELNNQSVQYQNLIASLSTIKDTSSISKKYKFLV